VVAVITIAIVKVATQHSASGPRRQSVPIVRVEQPSRDTVAYTLQSTGDVVSMQQANIVAKVSGTVEQVAASMGAQVRRDQLLALIDATELEQQVQQATATFVTAQADYQRTKQLLDKNLAPPQDFENAEKLMKVAEANYQTAQTRLGYARVTAPFAGTITKRYLDPGALVTANASTLFTLMDLDNVKVVINVLEKDAPLIAVGAEAVVTADALPDDSLAGRVGRLSQAVDPATRTMPVEVFVSNGDRRLKPGMYATVTLVLSEHPNAITVPTQAVLTDAKGQFAYVVRNDTARRAPVQTGIEQNARTEITAGLSGTERVITTGQQYVRDGAPVTVQQ
jgi:RND family efflux transporter MFP subunit